MNSVIVVCTVLGLIVNALAVLAIAWRGGNILGQLDATMTTLSEEVGFLRVTRDLHIGALERIVARLDNMDRRVDRLERPR